MSLLVYYGIRLLSASIDRAQPTSKSSYYYPRGDTATYPLQPPPPLPHRTYTVVPARALIRHLDTVSVELSQLPTEARRLDLRPCVNRRDAEEAKITECAKNIALRSPHSPLPLALRLHVWTTSFKGIVYGLRGRDM